MIFQVLELWEQERLLGEVERLGRLGKEGIGVQILDGGKFCNWMSWFKWTLSFNCPFTSPFLLSLVGSCTGLTGGCLLKLPKVV